MEVSFRSPSVSEEDVQEIFDSHNIPNLIGDSPLAAAECVVEATTFDDTKFQKDDVSPGTLPTTVRLTTAEVAQRPRVCPVQKLQYILYFCSYLFHLI